MQLIVALSFLLAFQLGYAWPVSISQTVLRAPPPGREVGPFKTQSRKLHGRFLHITDLHSDPFYKVHSSTKEDAICHRGSGAAGTYGAETSDCDSPFSLINQTFKWIEDNLRDTVDFVVWTGDSARHDNDEEIPRSGTQVFGLNEYVAEKFLEVFGSREDGPNVMKTPVIPTLGNNDIVPHNILVAGPNKWLRNYARLWKNFIPEEQRHGFERGGWFYVEVIPNKLAVFSLNTLYFFGHNAGVDGCAAKTEPGWEHMEWLRIQLQFIRERGMKAILMGHVPPARTESKQLWDETCWQKYTLWLRQYRDVVIGGIYGHMNIDHFMFQDSNDIDLRTILALRRTEPQTRAYLDDELTISSATNYLEELREKWSKLPSPLSTSIDNSHGDTIADSHRKGKNTEKTNKGKGGNSKENWGERFQITYVGPSVVPNYFPTLRVIHYNVTGLEDALTWRDLLLEKSRAPSLGGSEDLEPDPEAFSLMNYPSERLHNTPTENMYMSKDKRKKSKKGRKRKPVKNPDLTVPSSPSEASPPGPAYSPQTLTLLGYTQYFANLTRINNDILFLDEPDVVSSNGWRGGKHKGKKPQNAKPVPKDFAYEVEYSTFKDSEFNLKDMTVPSYLKLARRIGQYQATEVEAVEYPSGSRDTDAVEQQERSLQAKCIVSHWHVWATFDRVLEVFGLHSKLLDNWLKRFHTSEENQDIEIEKKQKNGKNGKNGKKGKKDRNRTWLAFIRRAFINTVDPDDMYEFYGPRITGDTQNDDG